MIDEEVYDVCAELVDGFGLVLLGMWGWVLGGGVLEVGLELGVVDWEDVLEDGCCYCR